MKNAARLAWLCAAAALGCGSALPPELPEPDLPPVRVQAEPACTDAATPELEPQAEALPSVIVSVGPAPSVCSLASIGHRRDACPSSREDALLAIDFALVHLPERRDELLAALEGCDTIETAAVRALRAELAPRACRDVFAEPMLHEALEPELASVIRALAIEARLERVAAGRPEVPFDGFETFAKEKLEPWLEERARLADELAAAAPQAGVGRRVVRLAHGRAILALASAAREAVSQVPACVPARFGRHGAVTAERCPVRLEGPGDAGARLTRRADKLEKRGVSLLRKTLDGMDDGSDMDAARLEEAIALVPRQPEAGIRMPEAAAVPAPIAGASGVSTRLSRRLPPLLVPILLGSGPEPEPKPPAAPPARTPICAGPGLARPRGGALIHAHQ